MIRQVLNGCEQCIVNCYYLCIVINNSKYAQIKDN